MAQPAIGQDGSAVATDGPGWLTRRDEGVRERFRQLLLSQSSPDVAAGWQLALDLGRPAVPVLWELLDQEKADVRPRLVLLAAAMMAGGTQEDERLFRYLEQPRARLEERTMAAMLVALGPARLRPVPEFWRTFLAGAKAPEHLLAIAVQLASVRVPGTAADAPALVADDPGVLAAAAFAGLVVPAPLAAKYWNLRAPERHADLFWRGAMLGASRTNDRSDTTRSRAHELLGLPGEALAGTRGAATWYLATGGELRPDGRRLDLQLLQLACGHLPAASALQAWLSPEPLPRDEQPERLAVAYALSRPPAEVIHQRARWEAEPRVRVAVALALAWQLCGDGTAALADDAGAAPFAEWNFVRSALGLPVDREASCADSKLAAGLRLCAEGRLDRPALRQLLEETLWRWGCHPRLGLYEAERLLVRDLLLAGSNPGGNKYQPSVRPDQRYIPSGLDRNDGFFRVAVAVFDFLFAPRPPLPAEHRLPG